MTSSAQTFYKQQQQEFQMEGIQETAMVMNRTGVQGCCLLELGTWAPLGDSSRMHACGLRCTASHLARGGSASYVLLASCPRFPGRAMAIGRGEREGGKGSRPPRCLPVHPLSTVTTTALRCTPSLPSHYLLNFAASGLFSCRRAPRQAEWCLPKLLDDSSHQGATPTCLLHTFR